MSVAGIVAEYNPFHRGHAHQIEETRRLLGAGTAVVCVMSGHWVQGADCAILDKWTRAGLALDGGVDLVLELSLPWAISSAEGFAGGAVALLKATGVVDHISFGSEAGELAPLLAAAECLESEAFRVALKAGTDRGAPFAAARQCAVRMCVGDAADCLSGPNNNLGVEYLRALRRMDSGMMPMTVLRRGAAHNAPLGAAEFASATAIRTMLLEGAWVAAEQQLLPGTVERIKAAELARFSRCDRALLARLRTMTAADFAVLPDSGRLEGLPDRMARAARESRSPEELFALAKTRRYSHARLRRLALWAFLGLTAADRPEKPCYLRVLGASKRGQALLREIGKTGTLPVLTKPAHAKRLPEAAHRLFALESRSTDLYALCREEIWPCGRDYTTGPVMR